jgi:hypothetical protein
MRSPADLAANSGLSEIAWQLALELRKVMGDHSDVEMPQDRLLGFAIKQKLESRLMQCSGVCELIVSRSQASLAIVT